jgi:hypothetical protein
MEQLFFRQALQALYLIAVLVRPNPYQVKQVRDVILYNNLRIGEQAWIPDMK